ncbi:hypothetical protein GDO81_011199 [Engystomops pustulosus]|uniref:Uncharacterized protein n=1 Tax=Engystomops pustulosus TaxID=76066 RepID=A0AAV7BD45_ENGPU|nr:hypothetical protein GDO81_011199 [Engystomops pustulosus]
MSLSLGQETGGWFPVAAHSWFFQRIQCGVGKVAMFCNDLHNLSHVDLPGKAGAVTLSGSGARAVRSRDVPAAS